MKKSIFAVVMFACFVTVAMAQQPATVGQAAGLSQVRNDVQKQVVNPGAPSYCKGTHCLYYAGDFDASNTGADGICLINNGTSNCETVIGVKPNKKKATVTGGTWNVLSGVNGAVGTNPTPFEVRKGVSSGNGGTVVCTSGGTVTSKATGRTGFGYPEYSYTIKKLSKSCNLAKGKLAFVGMQPTYSDGASWGFVSDAEDIPSPNHHGWPNVPDQTFSNYTAGGLNWSPAGGSSGFCGGLGCDVFSIALTGK